MNITKTDNRASKLLNFSKEPLNGSHKLDGLTLGMSQSSNNAKENFASLYENEKFKFIQEFNSNTNLNKNFQIYENCMTVTNLQNSNYGDKNNLYLVKNQNFFENDKNDKVSIDEKNEEFQIKSEFFKNTFPVSEEKFHPIHSTNRTAGNFFRNSKNQKNPNSESIQSQLNHDIVIYEETILNNSMKNNSVEMDNKNFNLNNVDDKLTGSNLIHSVNERDKILMKYKTLNKKSQNSNLNSLDLADKPFLSDRKKSKNIRYEGLDLSQTLEMKELEKVYEHNHNHDTLKKSTIKTQEEPSKSNSIYHKLGVNSDCNNLVSKAEPLKSSDTYFKFPQANSFNFQNKSKIPESKNIFLFQSPNSSTAETPLGSRKFSSNKFFVENINIQGKENDNINTSFHIPNDNYQKEDVGHPTSPILKIQSHPKRETDFDTKILSDDNYKDKMPEILKNIIKPNISNKLSNKITTFETSPKHIDNNKNAKELKETIEIRLYNKDNRLCKSERDNSIGPIKDDSVYLNVNNSGNSMRHNLRTSFDILDMAPNVTKVISSDNKLNKLSLSNKYVHLFGDVIRIPKHKHSNRYTPNKYEDNGDITNLKSRKASGNNSMRRDQMSENNNTFNESFLKMSLDQSIIKNDRENQVAQEEFLV